MFKRDPNVVASIRYTYSLPARWVRYAFAYADRHGCSVIEGAKFASYRWNLEKLEGMWEREIL